MTELGEGPERNEMQCTSYIPGSICRSGFPMGYPASSACTGSVCGGCGKPNDKLPACQNDDLGKPWIDDSGYPVHAQPNTN